MLIESQEQINMIVLVSIGSNHYDKYGEFWYAKTSQSHSICTGLATRLKHFRCYMISLSYRHKTKYLSPRSYACTRKCHPSVLKLIGLEAGDHTKVPFVETIAQAILHMHLNC